MKLTAEDGTEYEFEEVTELRDRGNCGTLKPVPKEWPQEGDKHYYIDSFGDVVVEFWSNNRHYRQIKDFSNIYKTEQEAEYARDRIKSLNEVSYHEALPYGAEATGELSVTLYMPIKYLKAWENLNEKD